MSFSPYVLKSHESFTYVSPDVFSVYSKSLIFNALYGIVRVSFSAPNASQQCGAFLFVSDPVYRRHVSALCGRGHRVRSCSVHGPPPTFLRVGLPEGTYNVTWDIVDGNTGAILNSWIYRNVKVHQGYNDETSTIRISSVDGEQQ